MTNKFKWTTLVFLLTLSACAGTGPVPDPQTGSAIEYAEQLRRTSTGGLDRALVVVNPGTTASHAWGKSYSACFSTSPVQQMSGDYFVARQVEKYCAAQGGRLIGETKHRFFCQSQSNPVLVYFTFDFQGVSPGRGCTSMFLYPVVVEEPKSDDPTNADYRAHLVGEGFRTPEERVADERSAAYWREKTRANAFVVAEEERKEELNNRISTATAVGTKICHSGSGSASRYSGYVFLNTPGTIDESGTIKVVGFLEGFSGSRIQIRVSGIRFINATGKEDTLNSLSYEGSTLEANSMIWDAMSAWHTCE